MGLGYGISLTIVEIRNCIVHSDDFWPTTNRHDGIWSIMGGHFGVDLEDREMSNTV